MASQSFQLWNLYCYGEEPLDTASGSYLGLFEIDLPDTVHVQIEMFQEYMHKPKDSPFQAVHTGYMAVSLAPGSNMKHEEVAKDISSLFSLAMSSHIACKGEREHLRPLETFGGRRKVIVNGSGKCLREFVEFTWPKYQQFKCSRKLPEVIRLLVQLDDSPQSFIEQKLALAAVMLENLKYTYAVAAGFPTDSDGFFCFKSKPKQRIGFKALLEKMLEAANLPTDVISLLVEINIDRNTIIHQGLMGCSIEDMRTRYDRIMDVIRSYLMHLLDYSGKFHPYGSPRSTVSIKQLVVYT